MRTKSQDQKRLTKTKLALGSLRDIVSGIIKDKQVMSPSELKELRLEVCSSCPFYENGKCAECGCIMSLKASLIKAKCPRGHWKEKIVEKLLTGQFDMNDIENRNCCG
jgi:hypothetical protein